MSEASSNQSALAFPIERQDIPFSSSSAVGEQYLRLALRKDITVLLPVRQLSEALTIPTGQIIPIPHMPAWVTGVYNWRGEILWMVDLGHLCGFAPWYQQVFSSQTYTAVVLQINDLAESASQAKPRMVGLIVNGVEDIEECLPNMIYPPPNPTPTPELEPFLQGFWWKSDDDMLAILNGEAILNAMPESQQ